VKLHLENLVQKNNKYFEILQKDPIRKDFRYTRIKGPRQNLEIDFKKNI
jgi:hypothetical protein